MGRLTRLLLIAMAFGISIGFVAAQDDTPIDDDLIPMPGQPVATTVPSVPTIESDDDLIPTVPTHYVPDSVCTIGSDGYPICQQFTPVPQPTQESICTTDKNGQTLCAYPTMATCYTDSHGQELCSYPTMIPTPTAPVSTLTPDSSRVSPGYWRQTTSTTSLSGGTCKTMGISKGDGDDGGPVPTAPLTPICQSAAGDFLFIDDQPEALIETLLYGHTTSERKLDLHTGTTSGSINTSQSIEYQVVNPGLITIHQTYSEDGGCTVESSSTYELVQTDANVCASTVNYMETLQPMSTPLTTGTEIAPTETTQLIPPGTYPVTWTMDSGTCTEKTQPTFTEARVDYANNGDMLLRLGDDEHTVFAIGTADNPRYQFFSSEWQLSVYVLAGGVIKMDWGKMDGMSMCFKGGELGGDGGTGAPTQPTTPIMTPTIAAGNQQYRVSFQPDEAMCPQAIQDKLPAFDGATIEKLPDGNYQMVVGGEIYAFTSNLGYATYDGSDAAQGITYQIALMDGGANGGQLGLTYMTASGQMCLAQMVFAAK